MAVRTDAGRDGLFWATFGYTNMMQDMYFFAVNLKDSALVPDFRWVDLVSVIMSEGLVEQRLITDRKRAPAVRVEGVAVRHPSTSKKNRTILIQAQRRL